MHIKRNFLAKVQTQAVEGKKVTVFGHVMEENINDGPWITSAQFIDVDPSGRLRMIKVPTAVFSELLGMTKLG